MEQSSPTIQRDSKTITQLTFPEERTTPMLPEEYIQTAKSEALTLTAPMLEAQNSVRYQKLTAKKEDITGKDVFNSNRELLFTVSDSNPVVYMLMLSSRQIENENKGQYMQQLYLLVREHASQRVSALSKTYDPELDNKIRNLLLYNSLKKPRILIRH